MDTNRLKKFATEARNVLIQGVSQRLLTLGYDTNGQVVQEPTLAGGGAIFLGETVSEDFYHRWQNMRKAIERSSVKDVVEEAAYTWFNRLTAIRIMVRNGLLSSVLEYESDDVRIPLIVSEARQGRLPEMDEYRRNKLNALLDDDSKTDEQFALLIVAFCHATPVINRCFGTISDYTELLLPQNILSEGGFVDMLNDTPFISEEDYKSPELIGWLYQYYISEKKDDVFASFKKGKKAEAEDIPAATQIFTPNWIVKYMVQNTVGRIYLDNNPYSEIKDSMKYLVEPEVPTPDDAIFHFDDIHELTCADLACGSGHILNECFDILYQIYVEEGYSRKKAIEDIFKYNLTGVDLDTRAKQLAQFALLMKACQKDPSFSDAHCMPKVLDMPEPYDVESTGGNLGSACLKFFRGSNNESAAKLEQDMELLKDANNLGSIMKFNDDEDYLAMLQHYYEDWTDGATDDCPEEIQALIPGVELILTLTKKYAALVMNPPYMGQGNMNADLAKYVVDNYAFGKVDLCTVFMMLQQSKTCKNGLYANIVPPSWMFLATFEDLRKNIIKNSSIASLLHLSRGVFGADFGSVATVVRKTVSSKKNGIYFRLIQRTFQEFEQSHLRILFESVLRNHNFKFKFDEYEKTEGKIYHSDNGQKIYYNNIDQDNFSRIPGTPIGYWLDDKWMKIFDGDKIGSVVFSKAGTVTGKDSFFLKLWHEVVASEIVPTATSFGNYGKYHYFQKGGGARRLYGNEEYVIRLNDLWNPDFYNPSIRRGDQENYFNRGIGWSMVSSGTTKTFRVIENSVCGVASPAIYMNTDDIVKFNYVLALLNTKLACQVLAIYNPTINLLTSNICDIPFIYDENKASFISSLINCDYKISHEDWDSHETSWDFVRNELLSMDEEVLMDNINYQAELHFKKTGEHICIDPAPPMPESVEWCYDMYCGKWERMFMQLHENEEELNRQFIEIYGLQDDLTPDVPLDEITILQQGEVSIENEKLVWHSDVVMKQLISYAVGCMMGRYSIDKEGLILANQGDGIKEFNALVPNSRFEVDDDGIVPLMASDTDFADNATKRFKQWLSIAFGEGMLVENLNFIEAAIGKSIDDYFVKDFWKDHKKMYQNRPIYWLFSSKKGAFQCLAYMHRMNPYTAELIRTKYLLPHIEWLLNKQQDLQNNAANLTTRERKELDNITKQIAECREYHDKLHAISQDFDRLSFDLDDGVVINYEKFGDVLAKLK